MLTEILDSVELLIFHSVPIREYSFLTRRAGVFNAWPAELFAVARPAILKK
jgi:hypothetical protein